MSAPDPADPAAWLALDRRALQGLAQRVGEARGRIAAQLRAIGAELDALAAVDPRLAHAVLEARAALVTADVLVPIEETERGISAALDEAVGIERGVTHALRGRRPVIEVRV